MNRRAVLSGLGLGAAFLATGVKPSWANFPSRNVHILCGFAPGGTADLLSRVIGEFVGPDFGQNVVIENRTGASGMIAADAVAKAAPDGHTVGLAIMAMHAVLPVMPGLKMPFDVDRDLTPIANVANIYNMMVASPQSASHFKSIPELIAYAKANPGKLSYASAGNGTSQHLSGELFKKLAGVDIVHIPYRGGAPAIIDIVAGRCDLMIGNMPEFLGQIRGGNLRPIAFGAPKQSPLFPDLPLISQTLPEFVVRNWFGIAGPGKLPANVVDRWQSALQKMAANADFQKRMTASGMEIIVGPQAEFLETIKTDRGRWQGVIKEAGIKAE
jgi:tripartite-type tricarboxylate transporter receptor subunit TctC